MALRATRSDDHGVGDRGFARQVERHEVFGLVGVQGGEDDRVKSGGLKAGFGFGGFGVGKRQGVHLGSIRNAVRLSHAATLRHVLRNGGAREAMTAPRLHVTSDLGEGVCVPMDAGQARYLGAVMRLGPGGEVRLFNGRDGEWLATIDALGKAGGAAACRRLLRAQTTTAPLALAFAPIKGDRGDMVIEKAVELGATLLVPVITARTIVRKPNLDRWRARAIEAAEQCERLETPHVETPLDLDRFLAGRSGEPLLFCDEAAAGAAGVPALAPGPATVLIGPEGGFAPAERAAILAAPGVRIMSLGPRILRADTAACAALVLVGSAPAARLRRLAHG